MFSKDRHSISAAISDYLEKSGLKKRVETASVIPEWPELVGAKIAEVTTPESVTQDGRLFVRVASAAWTQELQLMTPTILRQLRSRGKNIRHIYWKVG